jgi:hypothetical protein
LRHLPLRGSGAAVAPRRQNIHGSRILVGRVAWRGDRRVRYSRRWRGVPTGPSPPSGECVSRPDVTRSLVTVIAAAPTRIASVARGTVPMTRGVRHDRLPTACRLSEACEGWKIRVGSGWNPKNRCQSPPSDTIPDAKPWSEAMRGSASDSVTTSSLHQPCVTTVPMCRSGSSDTSFVGWRSSGPASAPFSTRRRVRTRRAATAARECGSARPGAAPSGEEQRAGVGAGDRPTGGRPPGKGARRTATGAGPSLWQLGSQSTR